jgi:hypothetical protein
MSHVLGTLHDAATEQLFGKEHERATLQLRATWHEQPPKMQPMQLPMPVRTSQPQRAPSWT